MNRSLNPTIQKSPLQPGVIVTTQHLRKRLNYGGVGFSVVFGETAFLRHG